jgi:hypothetical protein
MSIVNTFLELVVALLPLPVILSVKMTARQRWSIISILCLGVLVFLLGIVRSWFVWHALIATYDATWWGGPHWTVSEVENNVALVRDVVWDFLKGASDHISRFVLVLRPCDHCLDDSSLHLQLTKIRPAPKRICICHLCLL